MQTPSVNVTQRGHTILTKQQLRGVEGCASSPITLCDPAPGTRGHPAARATNLSPSTRPPCLGHPLWPGLGGTCRNWHRPKPFGEVYFYQGRSRSWNPPRGSPSPHGLGGGEGRPDPRGNLPRAFLPCTRSTKEPAPPADQAPLPLLLPPPAPSHMPIRAVCPDPKGGGRGLIPPTSSTGPGTRGLSTCCGRRNYPTFWATIQIWETSRTHHGILALEVQRKLKGHLSHLYASLHTSGDGELTAPWQYLPPSGSFPSMTLPPVPPECPLLGWEAAGGKLAGRSVARPAVWGAESEDQGVGEGVLEEMSSSSGLDLLP